MILIDSSVYVDWLRGRVRFDGMLEPWIRARMLCGCGLVRVEVLRGVLHPRQKRRVMEFFDLFPEVPIDGRLWGEAAELAWSLDRRGRVLPLTDVVIASCALRAQAILITSDQHFSSIPDLKTLPALPPGPSADA